MKKPNAIDVYIGARIRMRRLEKRMSQESLGDALGVSFQQIQKYEKGVNRVGGSRMQQLARVLDVEPGFFFEGAPGHVSSTRQPEPASLVTRMLNTRRGVALANAFLALTPDQQQAVLAIAEAFTPPAQPKARAA